MVHLDLLPAGTQPQHVGRHGPLGGIGVLALLYVEGLFAALAGLGHLRLFKLPPFLLFPVAIVTGGAGGGIAVRLLCHVLLPFTRVE